VTDFYLIKKGFNGRKEKYFGRFFETTNRGDSKDIAVSTLARKLGMPKTDTTLGNRAKERRMEEICRTAIEKGVVAIASTESTVAEYGLEFWDFNGRRITLANRKKPGSIGKGYADDMRQKFRDHIMPKLPKDCRLAEVNSSLVNRIQDELVAEGNLSNGTIEKAMRSLTGLMNDAQRKDLVQHKVYVDKIDVTPEKERGILTMSEIAAMTKALIDEEQQKKRDDTARLAIAVGMTTGMREGEIRALKAQDIMIVNDEDSILMVDESYSDTEKGYKCPKGKRRREVVCPTVVAKALLDRAALNPHKEQSGDIVFWSGRKSRSTGMYDKPVSKSGILGMFYHALELIGIDEKKREARNLVFHGLRHSYTSQIRGRVDDTITRLVVGHQNERTTDGYTHVEYDMLKPVAERNRQIYAEISAVPADATDCTE